MKISILCYDVSTNAFGRAYVLAKMLQPRYEVEILGPAFGDGIWQPFRESCDIYCRHIKFGKRSRGLGRLKELIDRAAGDIICVSKPLFTSYAIGLLGRRKRPIVLDVDDWEWGFARDSMRRHSWSHVVKRWYKSILQPHRRSAYFGTWLCEKLVSCAEEITVSNEFLRTRYGGTLIPHGRDEAAFKPEDWNQEELRQRHHIAPSEKVVMFLGTPRLHKGIEDLIEAVSLIPEERLLLALVGIDTENDYCSRLCETARRALGSRFRAFPTCPFDKIAGHIALSDIMVIPQRQSLSTRGQMPAKVFDAMAMARPVVATAVSDLPKVLDGCGWLVEPGNPEALARAILEAVSNVSEATRRGQLARKRFLEHYTYAAIRPRLFNVFSKFDR